MDKSPPLVFFVTTPDKKTAIEIAKSVIQKKIAACANILENLTSIFWWEGKINTEEECLIIFKTTSENSDQLISFIQNNHPYELPECIGINITKGSQAYLQWIADSTEVDN